MKTAIPFVVVQSFSEDDPGSIGAFVGDKLIHRGRIIQLVGAISLTG